MESDIGDDIKEEELEDELENSLMCDECPYIARKKKFEAWAQKYQITCWWTQAEASKRIAWLVQRKEYETKMNN